MVDQTDRQELVSCEIEGRLIWVTLNNSPFNVLNQKLLDQLDEVFDNLEAREDVPVVILKGGGEKAFAAGADIKNFPELDQITGERLTSRNQQVVKKIEDFKGPVIAAIRGYALGGGCEIALACDIRIASEDAKFGQPEVSLGVIPGMGGTQRLPRLIPLGKAKEMVYTGNMINAEEALKIGLIDKITKSEELLEEAKKLALRILDNGPLAIQSAKRVINSGINLPLSEGLKGEAKYFGYLCGTEDKIEGTRAFFEKRKPNFRGK